MKPVLLYPQPQVLTTLSGLAHIPKRFAVTGPGAELAAQYCGNRSQGNSPWLTLAIDTSIGSPEKYRLQLMEQQCFVVAGSLAGIRMALATVGQLLRNASLPTLSIEDWPLFPQRGFMLDISRDRVPSMDTLRQLVDYLAAMKGNHLQLYVEHTIAYPGHEEAWQGSGALTLEELAQLDRYAQSHGVALNANQNCLGHFERWLKRPRYAELGELSAPYMRGGEWYLEPNTLNPDDPRSLLLINDLLSQVLPVCSGPFANIGCDEPWDLGKGRSAARCAELGVKSVFSRHVAAVAKQVRALGKRPQFWCDPHPNEGDGLPEDLIALVWGYDHEPFQPRCDEHRRSGRSVWVAPGTSCWNTCTGRTWNRRANLAQAALTSGAEGFLCTAWGDGGHRQQWPITLVGLADACQAAWSGARWDNAALGQVLCGNPRSGDWLCALGDVDGAISRGECGDQAGAPAAPRRNNSALWDEIHAPLWEPRGLGTLADWASAEAQCTALHEQMPKMGEFTEDCYHAVRLARWGARRAQERRRNGGPRKETRLTLAAEMTEIIAEHRSLWLKRCRYGGLEDSCNWYRQLARQW